MSLCHSGRDLKVAVQDLWARLLQDNIKRLINSMPYHVEACIAAGGGPTRYWFCTVFESVHTLYLFNCLDFEIKWISHFLLIRVLNFISIRCFLLGALFSMSLNVLWDTSFWWLYPIDFNAEHWFRCFWHGAQWPSRHAKKCKVDEVKLYSITTTEKDKKKFQKY